VSAQIGVTDELWEVRGADGSVVVAGTSQSQAHQLVAAGVGVAALPETDHLSSLSI
jgi:DNA-binding transcriptional LysR family regulator